MLNRAFPLFLFATVGLALAGCDQKKVASQAKPKPSATANTSTGSESSAGSTKAAGKDGDQSAADPANPETSTDSKATDSKAADSKATDSKNAESKTENPAPTTSQSADSETTATASPADAPSTAPAAGLPEKTQSTSPEKVQLGSPELTAGIPGEGDLTPDQIKAWLDDPKNHVSLDPVLPLGLSAGQSQMKGLDANPLTRAKIELGRQLYFDPRLSSDGTVSCASCHHPDHGYAKETRFGVGVKNQEGNRNSPTAYNRILSDKQFWDGRAGSLEEQAIGPIANPIEMANTHEACVTTLKDIEGYRLQFDKIFGGLTIENVGQALASFERAVVTGPSPFDYYEQFRPLAAQDPSDLEDEPALLAKYQQAKAAAEAHPLSDSAKRGRDLFFGKANCSACHVGANLTDELYHNLGVGMEAAQPDLGRFTVSKEEKDKGAFKTPTIRNVAKTPPYMHDGSQKTLEEVVEWYNKGGHPNPHLSDKIKKLDLTDQEKQDLVAFMMACTGDFPPVASGRLPAR